jgi:hypothetical protein
MTGTTSRRRGLIVAITLLLGPALPVQADPIQATYSTTGVVGLAGLDGSPVVYGGGPVGSAGIDGTPVISFQGVSNGTLTSGQLFDVGQFVVGSMPAGTSTTYSNTPFQIAFTEQSVNGLAPSPNQTPVVIAGWLNGTVTAGSPLGLSVNYEPVQFPDNPFNGLPLPWIFPFQTGNLLNDFAIANPGNGGQVIQAALYTEQSVPEPTTLVFFACIFGLFVCRWRVDTVLPSLAS